MRVLLSSAEDIGSHTLLLGMKKGMATLEDSVTLPAAMMWIWFIPQGSPKVRRCYQLGPQGLAGDPWVTGDLPSEGIWIPGTLEFSGEGYCKRGKPGTHATPSPDPVPHKLSKP